MARDLESLADRLVVMQHGAHWKLYRQFTGPVVNGELVATFPREAEAWGVVSLVLENVNAYGYTEDYAITLALHHYRQLVREERPIAWNVYLDDDSRRAQDHAAEMRVWA